MSELFKTSVSSAHKRNTTVSPAHVGMAIDPVCGMSVDRKAGKPTLEHDGTDYHFCSKGCREKFASDPVHYLTHGPAGMPAPTAARPAPMGTKYTCPMHPEIVSGGPGSCPICGMALEPMGIPPADEGPNPELVDFQIRLKFGLLLTLPIIVLAMGPHAGLDFGALVGPRTAQILEMLLAIPAVFFAGWPFFERGVASVCNRSPNMWTLIMLGVGAAMGYSITAVLMPGLFPAELRDEGGSIGVYFEAAAVIVVLVLVGQVLELKARERTGGAIRALLDLAPKTAWRVAPDGTETEIPLEQVAVGDHLRVRPGNSVPIDGDIVEGRSNIDEKLLTGEPIPVSKGAGDEVTGGTLNIDGTFVMKARRVGGDTVLSRIVALVAEAQRSRAPIQSLVDRVSRWFVPAVVLIAAFSFLAWLAIGPEPRLTYAIVAAVSVLIIACPCALGLATPMSIMVATGRGARDGVLVRNAEALEAMASIDTLVIDKTGTLTEGRPTLTDVYVPAPHGDADVIRLSAAIEYGSEHPLATAIVRGARSRNIDVKPAETFAAHSGHGVEGRADGRNVLIGNARFLTSRGVNIEPLAATAVALAKKGRTSLFVAIDGKPAGVLGISDPIKPEAKGALQQLRELGIGVVMATGDTLETADTVARELGIAKVHAGVLPADKAELVRALKAQGRHVAFAGDGINDAPALAAAHAGIAMGAGADVAIESAGLTLPKGDLRAIVRAHRLATATIRNIKQNLALAFGYNVLAIPLAAGAFYPALGLLLSPIVAAFAMSLSSVSVIANALRLNRAV